MSGGVEWALHCCTLLSRASQPVPAVKLAEYHDVSPSYLAKQLQLMSRAGLVRSTQGNAGGYVLTRDAAAITVLDVVEAIDGVLPAFRCTEVRQRGPLATPAEQCADPCAIAKVMDSADRAWRDSLRAVTIADLVADADRQILPGAVERARAWLAS
ncbi:Rrf2 family transcriptional regulator [Actinoplanes philippinensis]|uniref:Rrf2 family protein n=1 Tax=Actinoplanes philippinensis TaxID=35752 RepID=A0A1I2KKI8_9ACTN|nr:Rrf2 family transcriptional regulator [Actinoplanes philippinensis]GIE82036.1 Rrf2 family transcriptional regulator [Actinoplanes philippinensis]SFF65631.1 Rrf2 family protein [Actinoplanes philippinensis]